VIPALKAARTAFSFPCVKATVKDFICRLRELSCDTASCHVDSARRSLLTAIGQARYRQVVSSHVEDSTAKRTVIRMLGAIIRRSERFAKASAVTI